MRKRGVPVWEVAGFLGHSSGYRTTERYAKYGPDHLGAAVRAIDAYFADLGVSRRPNADQLDQDCQVGPCHPNQPRGQKGGRNLQECISEPGHQALRIAAVRAPTHR